MLPVKSSQNSALISLLHAEFPNYHPLISIARIAHHESADLKLQFECHKVIAKYVEPELKSVEVKTNVSDAKKVKVSLFDVEDVQDVEVIQETQSAKELVTLHNW